MLSLLIVLLLACHLLSMNVCSAGPLLCIWLNRRSARPVSQQMALDLAWHNYVLLVIGVLFGFGLGITSWASGDFSLVDTIPLFESKVLWGAAEIGCSLVWSWLYWAWLRYRGPDTSVKRFLHAGLAVLSSTNLLYHFPPLMTVMSSVAAGEITVLTPVDSAAFRALIFSPYVLAHSLHIWLASFAVSGVYLFWLTRKKEDAQCVYQFGARLALVATLAQIGSGLWLIVVTPAQKQSMLLGGNLIATSLLVVSLLGAYYLLQTLAAIAFGETEKRLRRHCIQVMFATVVFMTGALSLLRG